MTAGRVRLTPVLPAVIYIVSSAFAGAAVALGLVGMLALPADSLTGTSLSLALPLGGVALLGVAGVAIAGARRRR